MPLDSVTLSALTRELSARLTGAKIDKVQQPERDTVLLTLRAAEGNLRLAVCGGVGTARVHVTAASYENPQQPPMFCMLLRKHLCGARIARLDQPERERIIIFRLDAFDEMGAPVQKELVVEMIGRGTNIILVGPDGRIIDCLRRVDAEMNPLRQVLPGLVYRLPVNPVKPDIFALGAEERRALWEKSADSGKSLDKRLLEAFSCLSPLVCREVAHRAGQLEENMPEAMDAMCDSVNSGEFTPWLVLEDGRPKDISFMPIKQYGEAAAGEAFADFSSLLDAFYTRRSKAEDMRRRASELTRSVKTIRDRVQRKLTMQREDLEKTALREEKKKLGDLITANIYRIKKGEASATVEDFYTDGCPELCIPLDKMKTPQQNAAAYYKEYTKLRSAERHLVELIEANERDLEYLNSVLDELERAEGEADLSAVRSELGETGFLRKKGPAKKLREKPAKPLRFLSSTGLEILVGRSNAMNDALTTKTARRTDYWLHTQKVHGSHVIICCEGSEPDETTLSEAASLAAFYSQARTGGKTPVDYTQVRFVKKPAGSLPGMVIYTDYKTIAAAPDEALAERLRVK